jgi:hypothetical protein
MILLTETCLKYLGGPEKLFHSGKPGYFLVFELWDDKDFPLDESFRLIRLLFQVGFTATVYRNIKSKSRNSGFGARRLFPGNGSVNTA